ncbi:hypothetical protein ABIB35_000944 [Arthrobacter sp. UYP6]|uniref:hypothetical protein n=1 Tax=Arthrobacter sp. UYP6 TaxID=1756378 RepID=UPI0033987EF5
MTWGQNEWLWLISIVLAVLISWFFGWKYGNRKRRLLFIWDAVQLMAETTRAKGALEVAYEGTPVRDPYMLQITVKNIGPVDITSSDFDDSRALDIILPRGYLTVVDITQAGVSARVSESPDRISIEPVLLRRGTLISFDVLVDGKPDVQLNSPLINTELNNTDAAARTLAVLDQGLIGVTTRPVETLVVSMSSVIERSSVFLSRLLFGSRR